MCRAALCGLFVTMIAGDVRAAQPALYDTVSPLSCALTADALEAKSGWKPAGVAPMTGDAVIENDRLALLLRRGEGRASIYYKLAGDLRECCEVMAIADSADPPVQAQSIAAAPASHGHAAVEAVVRTAGGRSSALRLNVAGNEPTVECGNVAGTASVALSYRSGHAVLPELFGDDLVLRAGEAVRSPLFIPADYAILHTLAAGDALLLCSWPPTSKEVPVYSGETEDRSFFARTEIPLDGIEKVWVSVLADNGIWHEANCSRFAISEYRTLDWVPPFPARYRADFRKEGPWALTDSWRRQPRRDKFWSAFFSNGFPPLVVEAKGRESLVRLPRFRPGLAFPESLPAEVKFTGPILVYPFERETDEEAGITPTGERTVLDILRATLEDDHWMQKLDIGEGILSAEPYPSGFVFVATCGATGIAEELFSEGKEKEEVETIRRAFADMNLFVAYHRARIEQYVAFAHAWKGQIEDRCHAHTGAELGRAAGELEPLLDYIPTLFEESRDTIKTPRFCEGLTEQAMALVDSEAPDKVDQVKKLGVAIRTIGGRQDDLLAAFRMAVKTLRQRAGQIHAASADPDVRELMRDLRSAIRSCLRICSPYEEHLFLTAAHLAEKQ